MYAADPDGTSDHVIGAAAIQYGFEELSKRKRETYLEAEFPHLWKDIGKFLGARLTTTQLRFRYFLGRNGRLS